MSGPPAGDAPGERPPAYVARTRTCLRCKAPFESGWAGERICARCKMTADWRNGSPPKSHPTGSRR